MGKFGKKVTVKRGLENYIIGILGPSGFGKTTLMKNVCEKEFGEDGYIILDMGMEDGTSVLEGANAEQVYTWSKLVEVVDDITENREDYPNLKVVVFDTLDETFNIAEKYKIAKWNDDHRGEKDFVKATSINSVEGGFGKGMDSVIDMVKTQIAKLKLAGVGVFYTAHVKVKDQNDLYTGDAYTSLTANMTQRYFNSIKNSTHVIGFGYISRNIESKEVGEADIVTKKKKTRKIVTDESRRIRFREDEVVADSKSRLSNITEEIPLDTDSFISAIKDAIDFEINKGTKQAETVKEVKTVEVITDEEPDATEEVFDNNQGEEILKSIKSKWSYAPEECTSLASKILRDNGIKKLTAETDVKILNEVLKALG